jgi:hypothetical protein
MKVQRIQVVPMCFRCGEKFGYQKLHIEKCPVVYFCVDCVWKIWHNDRFYLPASNRLNTRVVVNFVFGELDLMDEFDFIFGGCPS